MPFGVSPASRKTLEMNQQVLKAGGGVFIKNTKHVVAYYLVSTEDEKAVNLCVTALSW